MYSGFLPVLSDVNWAQKADKKRVKIQLQVSRGGATIDTQPWDEAETRKHHNIGFKCVIKWGTWTLNVIKKYFTLKETPRQKGGHVQEHIGLSRDEIPAVGWH